MNRFFLVAAMASTNFSCKNGGFRERCVSNSDCDSPFICTQGVCLFDGSSDDGGTGGGTGGETGTGGGNEGQGGGLPVETCSSATAASCAGWQECIPDMSGGRCQTAGLKLTWLSPGQNSTSDGGPLAASLRIEKEDGGLAAPIVIPVRGPLGTDEFLRTHMLANGTLKFSEEGPNLFIAGWEDGGVTASLTVSKDSIPPHVSLIVTDRPNDSDSDPQLPRSWKKNERALVRVNVDDVYAAVSPSSFSIPWGGGVTLADAATCGCAVPGCSCFRIDLASTVVNGIHGTQGFSVQVSDAVGNASDNVSGTISVTRFKWRRNIASISFMEEVTRPVAISENGLVVASTYSGTPYRVSAFSQSGDLKWQAIDAGIITAGPVIGKTNVWVAHYIFGGSFRPAALISMNLNSEVLEPNSFKCAGSKEFSGDLALASVVIYPAPTKPIFDERPIGVDQHGVYVGDDACSSVQLPVTGTPNIVVQPASLDDGINVYVASNASTELSRVYLDQSQHWSAIETAGLPTPVTSLFLDGNHIGGGLVFKYAAFSTSVSVPLSNSTVFEKRNLSAQQGPISVGNNFIVYGDSRGRLVKVSYTNNVFGNDESAVEFERGATLATNPVIGANNHIYSITASGALIVSNTDTLAEEWRDDMSLIPAQSTLAQPALDILRDETGAPDCRGLGVLYLSADGALRAATLTAVVVDSPGLEPTAPWPKYQRDNANTGNTSRPLTPWTCP